MNASKVIAGVAAIWMLVSVCGCFPEERIVWSPDGKQAVVLANDGLCLCDAQGKLTPPLVEDAVSAAWMGDSKRLLIVRKSQAATWEQASELLTPERQRLIIENAGRLREEVLAHPGPLGADTGFEPKSVAKRDLGDLVLMLMYLREHNDQGLAEKAGPDNWAKVQQMRADVYALVVAEPAGEGLQLGPVLCKSLWPMSSLRVSPNAEAVAFVSPDRTVPTIYVAPISENTQPVAVAAGSDYADWSPDGKYLAYVHATPGDGDDRSLRLGAVARRQVADSPGNGSHGLLATFPPAEDLAGLIYGEGMKVRCLRDGRILFATPEVRLPATAEDMPQQASLFTVLPGRKSPVARVLTRSTGREVTGLMNRFDLSPDETKALVFDNDGLVTLIDLENQTVEKLQTEKVGSPVKIAPSWRDSGHLTFEAASGTPYGAPDTPQVVLYDLARKTVVACLSAAWPAAAVQGLLAPAPTTQPASEP